MVASVSVDSKDDVLNILKDSQVREAIQSLSDHYVEWWTLGVLAFTAAIAGVTAYLLLRQVRDARREQQSEHIRLQREFAVRLIDRWTDEVKPGIFSVVRLVKKLPKEQCLVLADRDLKPLYLDATGEMRELVDIVLEENFPGVAAECLIDKDKGIVIKGKTLYDMKFAISSYLNLLESILSAWDLSVADRKIIVDQFAFLRMGNENDLETYRNALRTQRGDDGTPALSRFISAGQDASVN